MLFYCALFLSMQIHLINEKSAWTATWDYEPSLYEWNAVDEKAYERQVNEFLPQEMKKGGKLRRLTYAELFKRHFQQQWRADYKF